MSVRVGFAVSLVALCAAPAVAQGFDIETGGKLRLTRGISTVEGQGGGGLTPWATITGDETDRGMGASAHATMVELPDYGFISYGVAVGLFDRVELSYTREEFDTRDVGAALGLGQGFTFGQDVFGAKLKLTGDAVYAQDTWMPQVAVGANWKMNDQDAIVHAIGATDSEGWEAYASATKILLDQSILLNGTLRWTNANQTGLLGFGGDKQEDHELEAEASLGWLVNRYLLVGGEYRMKPDNLGIAQEDDWLDLFAAWSITRELTLTGAYADLGSIATFEDQRGFYLSLQAGF
ncbi:MAG TPA: DUF3034 family protein [Hyphomonadaceae bacterium]|jgi:hypothetical protein|nr:DUF3034 family protein [Hyphomonadaceae bacterium]